MSYLRTDRKTKAALFLTALVGNTIYMGFPLVGSAARQADFAAVVAAGTIHLAVGIALSILAVEFYVLRSKNIKTYVLDFIKHPLILSMALGFALSFVKLPEASGALKRTLLMLGSTASPVALLALGGFLHGRFMRHHLAQAWLSVVLKLVLFPLFLFLASFAFVLPGHQAGISALLAGMPTAVTAFVVAEKYKLDESFVASCIVLTTVVSLFTISAFLFFFPR
jgi:predicted permease